ncbi:MAG: hypothetical protein AAGA62_19185, partial [Bacteroidota bacterium]
LLLLILPPYGQEHFTAYFATTLGIMLGLGGLSIGGGLAFFNQHYKGIYHVITQFGLDEKLGPV